MITADTVFLVVDDADTMRKVNSSQLERLGARHVLLASNGAEALAILRARKVSVILSDWCMPVMDGLALLRECAATPNWRRCRSSWSPRKARGRRSPRPSPRGSAAS